MTVHTPTAPQPRSKPATDSFSSWLGSQTSLFVGHLVGVCSTAALISSLIYYNLDTGGHLAAAVTPELLQRIIYGAHIPFILLCIIYLLINLNFNDLDLKKVADAHQRIFHEEIKLNAVRLKKSLQVLREFKRYFLLFWLSMLALYIAFFLIDFLTPKKADKYLANIPGHTIEGKITHIGKTDHTEKIDASGLVETSNNQIEVEPIQNQGGANSKQEQAAPLKFKEVEPFKTSHWKDAFIHILPEFLPFAFNTVSLMFVFWCLSILYVPYQNRKEKLHQLRLVHFSGLSVFFLIVSFPLLLSFAGRGGEFSDQSLREYTTIFNGISGTLNAVVLALLIARLDSKLIGLRSWLVSILYVYAGVQPLFVVFSQPGFVNEVIKTVVLLFVFILKIYFFLIIVYAMQTERMLNYVVCFPTLSRRVNSIFDNKFEITIQENKGLYGFTISRNHAPIYQTKHRFGSVGACSNEVVRLRTRMCYEDAYDITDTFTVDVRNKAKDVRCSSIHQRSHAEAKALILESIHNIPYCRVNEPPK